MNVLTMVSPAENKKTTLVKQSRNIYIDKVIPWLVFPTIALLGGVGFYHGYFIFLPFETKVKAATPCSGPPLPLSIPIRSDVPHYPSESPSSGLSICFDRKCNSREVLTEDKTLLSSVRAGSEITYLPLMCFRGKCDTLEVSVEDTYTKLLSSVGSRVSLAVFASISYVEGTRDKRNAWIHALVVPFVLSGTLSAGMLVPIYWLQFILSGIPNIRVHQEVPSSADLAQSQDVPWPWGLIVGCILQTLLSFIRPGPYIAPIWELFPALVDITQLVVRPNPMLPPVRQKPYKSASRTYFTLFFLTAAFHIVPNLWRNPTSTTPTTRGEVLQLFETYDRDSDADWAHLSSMLASLWFAHNLRDFAEICGWYVLVSKFLGPNAKIAAVFYWRERIPEDTVKIQIVPQLAPKETPDSIFLRIQLYLINLFYQVTERWGARANPWNRLEEWLRRERERVLAEGVQGIPQTAAPSDPGRAAGRNARVEEDHGNEDDKSLQTTEPTDELYSVGETDPMRNEPRGGMQATVPIDDDDGGSLRDTDIIGDNEGSEISDQYWLR